MSGSEPIAKTAHELNNLHGAIQGFVELLLRDPGLSAQARADLTAVRDLLRRASEIVAQLHDRPAP